MNSTNRLEEFANQKGFLTLKNTGGFQSTKNKYEGNAVTNQTVRDKLYYMMSDKPHSNLYL